MPPTKTPAARKRVSAKSTLASRKPVPAPGAKRVLRPVPAIAKPAAQPPGKDTSRVRGTTKDFLQAGFSALSLPRAESAMADGLSKIADSIGFKRLEDVFDQRVASALERLGMPSSEAVRGLIEKVEALSALVEAKGKKAKK